MNTRSKPCAARSARLRSPVSNRCASTPAELSACCTPAPDISDTSRSAERPPYSTPPCRIARSCQFSHLGRDLADRPRAHHDHHVAVPHEIQDSLRQFRHVFHEHRFDLARHPQRARDRARPSAATSGGSPAAYTSVSSTASAVPSTRTKSRSSRGCACSGAAGTPARCGGRASARGSQGGGHFHRMVAVVVDDGEGAAAMRGRHGEFARLREATAHALEGGQRFADGLIGHAHRWPRRSRPARCARCAGQAGSVPPAAAAAACPYTCAAR